MNDIRFFVRDFPIIYRLYAKKMIVNGLLFHVPIMIFFISFQGIMDTSQGFILSLLFFPPILLLWVMFDYYRKIAKKFVAEIKRGREGDE